MANPNGPYLKTRCCMLTCVADAMNQPQPSYGSGLPGVHRRKMRRGCNRRRAEACRAQEDPAITNLSRERLDALSVASCGRSQMRLA